MKKVEIILVCIFCSGLVLSQNVNSSCDAPDSIRNLYRMDAARLVVRDYYDSGSPYMDSIVIQEDDIEEMLDGLIALYNAEGLPSKDTVMNFLNIHSWPTPNVRSFNVGIDTTAPYLQNLHDGISPCGNSTIDSLMDLYELNICYYSTWSGITSFHSISLCSENYLNMEHLIAAFDTISGVFSAEPSGTIGSGNDIEAQKYSDYISFKFTYGWGDCPSGCINHRYWYFRVYDDCSVVFWGASGNIMPDYWTYKSVIESNFSIQPNPFGNFIHISGLNGECEYSVYDLLGTVKAKGISLNSKIDNLGFLPAGQYILKINNGNKTYTRKIVKI